MHNMTSAERITACVNGEPVDRVPYGIGLGWWPWTTTMERWRSESGDEALDLAREFGFDAYFVCPPIEQNIFPRFERITLEETDEFTVFRDERGVTQRRRKTGISMPQFLDYPVKTRDDWERLKAERLAPHLLRPQA